MINLTQRVGFPVFFNPKTLDIKFSERIVYLNDWSKTLSKNSLWKSLKLGSKVTDNFGNVTGNVELWKYRNPDDVLYRGFQGVFWKDNLDDLVENHRIRPDITALHAGTLDGELIRTEGHEHLSGFPEIYETVYGKNGYLLFKPVEQGSEDIEDVVFVVAEAGDHVLFPPGYHHITVNLGKEGFLMTDFVSPDAQTDFGYIKKHNGGPYWVVQTKHGFDFEKNPKYKDVPEIRVVRPCLEVPVLGIKKGEPMFNLVREGKIDVLKFLNDSADRDFYEKAFVDF